MVAKTSANNVLGEIAHDIVMQKVIKDKLAAASAEQEAQAAEDGNTAEARKHTELLEDIDDLDISKLREARLKEFKYQQERSAKLRELGHGTYQELTEEEFAQEASKHDRLACHFYHDKFERCKIIDYHMKKIAERYLEAKFIKLNAEKAPFFTARLGIKVLPSVLFLINGEIRHITIGFRELSGNDNFRTSSLEKLMVKHGLLEQLLYDDNENDDDDDA